MQLSKYADSLRDPRWQKKRLLIMSRDNFTCVACGVSDQELTVHHKRYRGLAWESPENDLQTLCIDCHTSLGKHPRGGVYFVQSDCEELPPLLAVYEHCPLCGCKEDDSHSGGVRFECGHSMELPETSRISYEWMEYCNSYPAFRLSLCEIGNG